MYAKWIDKARIAVAILFTVFGLGFIVCVNLRCSLWAMTLGFGTVMCFVAALGLCVEYLIRSWVETRRNGTKAYQFTLAQMLKMTAAVAVALSFYRILGIGVVALLVVAIILSGCAMEVARRSGESSKVVGSPSGEASPSSGDDHGHARSSEG